MGDALEDVRNTLGATLIGTFLSAVYAFFLSSQRCKCLTLTARRLSGILSLQVAIYFQVYTVDFTRNRVMVRISLLRTRLHASLLLCSIFEANFAQKLTVVHFCLGQFAMVNISVQQEFLDPCSRCGQGFWTAFMSRWLLGPVGHT